MHKRLTLRCAAGALAVSAALAVAPPTASAAPASQNTQLAPAQPQAQPAPAQPLPAQAQPEPLLLVAEVNGLIDAVTASYLREQIAAAASEQALALVLQIDSTGTTLSDSELADLLAEFSRATIPIGVWVGPSGATLRSGAAHLADVADFAALAPGSTIGQWSELSPAGSQVLADSQALTSSQARPADPNTLLEAQEAVAGEVVAVVSPSIGDFLLALSDAEVIAPISAEVTNDAGVVQRTLSENVSVTFVQLSLLDSLFHTAASPAIAYLLLLVALSMVLLDFFTGGVGVAAAVGVGALALGAYGLGELDIRIWALVALVGAFVAFGIDLQTAIPRFWTAAGCVLLLVGSLFLFGQHTFSWLPYITGVGFTATFVLFGMPALIRTRYGTAAVDRQWLIGAVGVAATDIDPEGVLQVGEGSWSARVTQQQPLRKGEPAVVTGLAGVVLEVEPPPPA